MVKDEGGIWRMDLADMEEKIVSNCFHVMIFCPPHLHRQSLGASGAGGFDGAYQLLTGNMDYAISNTAPILTG